MNTTRPPDRTARAAEAMATAARSGADTLDLHGLGLKSLPPWPDGLTALRRVDLSGNRLAELPAALWNCTHLEELDLAGNRLAQLDAGIGRLAQLRVLDLSENRLAELPAELAACTRLERLDLFGNQLAALPAAVRALPALRELDLARNRVAALPALPLLQGALPALAALDLAGNGLADPEALAALAALPALRVLNLDDNRLAAMPPALHRPGLVLSSRGNPLAIGQTPRGLRLRSLVADGAQEGRRYFDKPEARFAFAVALEGRDAVRQSLDLYFKGFAGTPVAVQLDNGVRVDLARVGRRAALDLAAAAGGALVQFAPTADDALVDTTCELAERTLDRVPGAALLTEGTQQAKPPAASETPEMAGAEPPPTPELAGAEPPPTPEMAAAEPPPDAPQAQPVPAAPLSPVSPVPPEPQAGPPAAGPAAAPAPDPAASAAPPPLPPAVRDALPRGDVPPTPDAEPVDAAVFCPPRVARDSTFLVQAFLYPAEAPDAAPAVDAQAREADPQAQRRGTYSLPMELPRGTRVGLHLEMPGLTVPEPDATLVWRGRTLPAQFDVTVPAAATGETAIGRLRIDVDGLPAGTLRFQVALGDAGTTADPAEARALRARRYRRAFVSYSSKDRAEVLRRVQAFRIAGISVFQDVLSLDPGERWEREVYREIDACDVFFLFWSKAAAESHWVGKEIDYAMQRKGGKLDDDRPPDIQPVPIEGPPIPLPPAALESMHFNDELLAHIAVAAAAPAPAPVPAAPPPVP